MTWEKHIAGRNFITDLGEPETESALGMNRFAAWVPDLNNPGKHCIAEIGSSLKKLEEKYHVSEECIFYITEREG